MQATIRSAKPEDTSAVVALVTEMAVEDGETTDLAQAYAAEFLRSTGCGALLAEVDGRPVGLLSYTIRPDLYHAGPTCLIQELVVTSTLRGQGVGSALLEALISQMRAEGMQEVSVSTMPDNHGAIAFYRRHGLTDEAVLLEKHF